jgi:23S rRNA G2445 N2-methylase RlmL
MTVADLTCSIDTLRLVGAPDTNKVMAGELSRLSRRALGRVVPPSQKAGTGALVLPFDRRLAHLAVHYHRTASRVLRDLYLSRARRLEPLYEGLVAAVAADRRPWASSGLRISVEARNVGAFAAGERQIVGTVKNALIDGCRRRGLVLELEPQHPDLLFAVRMHDDELTVSIDLAGGPMHQRGYRLEAGPAPLRENLAAALVMLARHDPRSECLLDPVAGSGTIAIEAALMARAAPLWTAGRLPALVRLPEFADPEFATPVREPLFADTAPLVLANEQHRGAVRVLRSNAERAGVLSQLSVRCGDFRSFTPREVARLVEQRGMDPDRGLILGNPPYGERLQEDDLVQLYRDLGDFCAQFRGWRAGFLVANEEFLPAFGHRPRVRKPLRNGPLRAEFLLYEL